MTGRSTDKQARFSRVLLKDIDDRGEQQMAIVEGLDGEQIGGKRGVYLQQRFGASETPPVGSHGLLLSLNGQRGQGILLGFENSEYRRRELNYGEKEIYDAHGNVVSLVQKKIRVVSEDSITLVAPAVALDSPKITYGGKVDAGQHVPGIVTTVHY